MTERTRDFFVVVIERVYYGYYHTALYHEHNVIKFYRRGAKVKDMGIN